MCEVMTPEQVAEYLQLSLDHVYRLIQQGKLAAIKVGRISHIAKSDVEAFLRTNSTDPELRSALFKRVMEIAERNPDVDSDNVLEELEAWDEERKAQRARAHR